MNFSVEQVTALAPDASAAKAGRSQATVSKWPTLGRMGNGLWGNCQGSGSKPYQVRIDLNGPAFKCSCPSFKIPCKHSLGLLFLFAEKPELFVNESSCDFLSEWLADREKRAEQKAKKKVEAEAQEAENPELAAKRKMAQEKRQSSRDDKVAEGVAELAAFLQDIVREGLASLPSKPYSFWNGVAARLIDAQAPGLARQVSELGSDCQKADWQSACLHRLGRLHLACEGWIHGESLSELDKADLKAFIGYTVSQDNLPTPSAQEEWSVMAQAEDMEKNLRHCQTWLQSQTGQSAVLHQYAFGAQSFEGLLAVNSNYRLPLAFFPSSLPLRAALKGEAQPMPFAVPQGLPHLGAVAKAFAEALAKNPLLETYPFLVENVVPVRQQDSWWLQSTRAGQSEAMPLQVKKYQGWRLLASSQGAPIHVYGEYDGEYFFPLSLIDGQGHLQILREEDEAWQ